MTDVRFRARLRVLLTCAAVLFPSASALAQQDTRAEQLLFAASEGDIRTATRVLDSGFDVNSRVGMFEQFALLKAAEWGQVEMVRFLLSRGANPLLEDSSGRTPRDWALDKHPEVVRVLRQAEGLPEQAQLRQPAAPRQPTGSAQPRQNSPPPPRPATPAAQKDPAVATGVAPRDGRWRGTIEGITDGGTQYVSFVVRGGQIVESTFHLDYHCAPQYVYRERTTLGFDRPIPVVQGRFTATRKAPAVELNATGRFSTLTRAEGTFKMEDSKLCTTRLARWTAQRVGS